MITVENTEKLIAKINKIPTEVAKAIRTSSRQGTNGITKTVKALAFKDTGFGLKQAKTRALSRRKDSIGCKSIFTRDGYYMRMHDQGYTLKNGVIVKGQNWMKTAADINGRRCQALMMAGINTANKQAVK